MKKLKENIDRQIEFNQGKNIFLDNLEMFQFANDTVKAISEIDLPDAGSQQLLIDYATDKAIEEFCRVNQYYSFNEAAKQELRAIYADLTANILAGNDSAESISKKHYENLQKWLAASNPFAEKIYKNAAGEVEPVACSEYSAKLQMSVLNIDAEHLLQPVLDIGCGKEGYLVKHLQKLGLEACGIDRFGFSEPGFQTADWLEFSYGKEKWGTIISHMGFSNHFNHHNLRNDGNYIQYGTTYMNILHSLKIGGSFHYTPDLPFIEQYLEASQFELQTYIVNKFDFKATVVKRLR